MFLNEVEFIEPRL